MLLKSTDFPTLSHQQNVGKKLMTKRRDNARNVMFSVFLRRNFYLYQLSFTIQTEIVLFPLLTDAPSQLILGTKALVYVNKSGLNRKM